MLEDEGTLLLPTVALHADLHKDNETPSLPTIGISDRVLSYKGANYHHQGLSHSGTPTCVSIASLQFSQNNGA